MTEPAEEFPCGNCSKDTGSDAMAFCSQPCQAAWVYRQSNDGKDPNPTTPYWVPQHDMTRWRGVQ